MGKRRTMDLDVQDALPMTAVRRKRGACELAAQRAVAVARKADSVLGEDVGAVAALYAAARTVDRAEANGDTYALPQAIRELRASLADLLLTPAAREGTGSDDADDWLRSISAPASRDGAES
jgi:hypothetical protein